MTQRRCLSELCQRYPFRPLVAALLTLALTSAAQAAPESASFATASQAFSQGRYQDAAAGFEAVANTRGFSAPLLYNLANAYAHAGQVGRAILNYRRAQLLAPRDSEIAANLAFVRTQARLPAPPAPVYQAALRLLTPTAWTWLAACGWWLAAAAASAALIKRPWRKYMYPAALAAFVVALPAAAAAALSDHAVHEGVVVAAKNVALRLAPFDTAPIEAMVEEGQSVELQQVHGDFVRVRDGQSHVGWVESQLVQPIVPRSR